MNFDRPLTAKSKQEEEFDRLNAEYQEKFGEPYTFRVGLSSDTWEEVLKDIRDRIRDGRKQEPPDYEKGKLY